MSELNGEAAVATAASKANGVAIAKSVAATGAAVVVNYTVGKEDADRSNASHAFAPVVLHTTKNPSAIIPGGVHQGLRPTDAAS
jgi:NAD(P)-dependent dehydrogenase (short-subunit alcohol dehydrogenase family)